MRLWDLYKGKDYKIQPTLDRIRNAVKYLGNPQKDFPSLQVGGTNGKGSTCAFLERILREHGFKTGWFVSPHLVDERERWRVNGELIEEDTLNYYLKDLKDVFYKFDLTYFEAATLIALMYFRDVKVDVAVVEVGMGGRWDATKVFEPQVVAITNVERDHTRWLGDNVYDIALDKIHLYRRGFPLLLGSSRFPLYPVALERCSPEDLIVAGYDFTYRSEYERSKTFLKDYTFGDLKVKRAPLGLWGKWQADNSALALSIAKTFTKLSWDKIERALKNTKWEGRFEVIREKPLTILDGSHNPYAVEKIVKEVVSVFPQIEIVFSGLKDKEWDKSLEAIKRYRDSITLVPISYHRGEDVKKMSEKAKSLGFKKVRVLSSVEDLKDLKEDILVLGSLYLVGEVKKALV